MPAPGPDHASVDDVLKHWRQGDVSLGAGLEFLHLADLSNPQTDVSRQLAESDPGEGEAVAVTDEVPGLVVLSQTCDVVMTCEDRPFVEVAPLQIVSAEFLEQVRRQKRPAFAYIPAVADQRLVAHLDRTMTVEKAVLAGWPRTPGWHTDEEIRAFATALARKRSRFAFPDDFVDAARAMRDRILEKYDKKSREGGHLRKLQEIRVRAAPSWSDDEVVLSWWFIKDSDPEGFEASWPEMTESWLGRFDQSGRFLLDPPTVCRLEDMSARDYVESDLLDFDRLSVPRGNSSESSA